MSMRLALALTLLSVSFAPGCTGVDEDPATYPDPTVSDEVRLELALVAPTPFSSVDTPRVNLTLSASDVVAIVEVATDDGAFEPARRVDGGWSFDASLSPGDTTLWLRARTESGRRISTRTGLRYAGLLPSLRIESPAANAPVGTAALRVTGVAKAIAPRTLTEVSAQLAGGAWQPLTLSDGGRFDGSVAPGAGEPSLVVKATDSQGDVTSETRALARDADVPVLAVLTPATNSVVNTSLIEVRGDASDSAGIDRVEVRVNDAGWIVASGTDSWRTDVSLSSGANVIQVRALDRAGHQTELSVDVFRAKVIRLSPPPTTRDATTITMTRTALEAFFPEEEADEIIMLYLDVRGLLVEALRAMKDYAEYGVDTSRWGPAEWNMQRILTMTPDTADVTGTSMESLLTLATNIGIPVPQVLGDTAGIAPTEPFVPIERIADAIFDNVLAPHPAMVPDPADGQLKVPITLYDAFQDLTTLSTKLGPVGDHPGVLFDSPPAKILMPNFAMVEKVWSNLLPHDGLDLGRGKDYLFILPAGPPLIEHDFLTEDGFTVLGLADEPEVDLAFAIQEVPTFVPAGTARDGNPDEDGVMRGNGAVWGLETWNFEHLVADMTYKTFRDRHAASGYQATVSYDVGAVTGAAKLQWDRGWLEISTAGGIGAPPPPQYWWDAVVELAQVRLHDGGLAEGEANLRLRIDGVRVPLTTKQLIEAARPVLDSQKAELTESLVGDHSGYTSACDIYLARSGPTLMLRYVAAEDVPGQAYAHTKPGFFADPGLTQKTSVFYNEHEELALTAEGGQVVYAAGEDGVVWRLTLGPLDPSAGLDITVEPSR